MAGANQVLGDAGYQMVTLIANSEDSTRRIAQLVQSDFSDGYLLFSLSEDSMLANTFASVKRPVVLSEVSERENLPFPAVDFTNTEGQRDITRYLLDQGRTKLVYVCGPGYSPSSNNRFDGFKAAMGDRFNERHSTTRTTGRAPAAKWPWSSSNPCLTSWTDSCAPTTASRWASSTS